MVKANTDNGSGLGDAVDCDTQTINQPRWFAKLRTVLASPWLGIALVAGLVWVLLQMAPLSEWRDALLDANPWWLLGAVALALPYGLLKTLRLERLLPQLSEHRAAHLHIVFGMEAMGQLPTGTLGGDVYRICRLGECGVEMADAAGATYYMRLAGFSVTVMVAAIAGTWVLGSVLPLAGILVAAAIVFALANAERPPSFLQGLANPPEGRGAWSKVRNALGTLLRKIFECARTTSRTTLMQVLGFTLAMYSLRATILWVCLRSVGVEVPVWAALAALSVGNLLSAIPSPAGSVGLREGGIVGVLSGLGAAATPATIGALLFRAVVAVGAGAGYLLTLPSAKSSETAQASLAPTE